jgi:hypothetical protein
MKYQAYTTSPSQHKYFHQKLKFIYFFKFLIQKDDVWVCGRVYSDNAIGGGCSKLTEHNIHLQGSYMCSNSHSIPIDMSGCNEYSLFPGQLILANGRNPDGKRFLCKQIVEVCLQLVYFIASLKKVHFLALIFDKN